MMGIDGRPLGRAPARWVQWQPFALSGISGGSARADSPAIGRAVTYELRGGTWHTIAVSPVTWSQAIAGRAVGGSAYPPGPINSELAPGLRQVELSHQAAARKHGVWVPNKYEV